MNFFKKLKQIEIFLLTLLGLISIISFEFFSNTWANAQDKKIQATIESIFHKNYSVLDPNAIAQQIEDLTYLELFKCVKLEKPTNGKTVTFIDLQGRDKCSNDDKRIVINIIGGDGNLWKLSYSRMTSDSVLVFQWMIRVLFFVLMVTFSFIIIQIQRKKIELEKNKEKEQALLTGLAKQVSHDIRSPLSALTMVLGQLKDIPEGQRLIIRNAVNRINDIANTLLTKAKEQNSQKIQSLNFDNLQSTQTFQVALLPALVDSLISEKRIQFRDKIGVEIEVDLKESYGCFVNINPTELCRVLSNLANNSIESFQDGCGKFILSLIRNNGVVTIVAKDNGKGIPDHILKKLGIEEISYGKEGTQSGSGIGIYHARATIESFNGQFKIESVVNVGTTITITLPLVPAPNWFVEKILLNQDREVVSLDDDLSIHEIWNDRFRMIGIEKQKVKHFRFTSANEFIKWVKNSEVIPKSVDRIYLVDYEFLNQNTNGLEIIESLGIGAQAILVTSRYDEINVREKCNKLSVRIIPKGMASLVPIEIEMPKEKIDSCLIDDDFLIRTSWEMVAKEKGHNLKTFDSFENFMESAGLINKDVPISIDMNLKNGIRGTDVALKLNKMGYNQLFLATGYESSHLANEVPDCVIEVRGKEPVF